MLSHIRINATGECLIERMWFGVILDICVNPLGTKVWSPHDWSHTSYFKQIQWFSYPSHLSGLGATLFQVPLKLQKINKWTLDRSCLQPYYQQIETKSKIGDFYPRKRTKSYEIKKNRSQRWIKNPKLYIFSILIDKP